MATRRGCFWFVALAFGWLAAGLGMRTLMKPDETRYIGVAYDMLRSGDWVVPTLNGLPFFHKPPLFYWLSALSMQVFGPHDWAARVPAFAGALAVALAMFAFVRRWQGERAGRLVLLLLATQPGFFLGAQYANLDMLVAGCIGMTVLAMAQSVLVLLEAGASASPRADAMSTARRWMTVAALGAGVGVLAKGLIGVVLPFAVLLVWLGFLRQIKVLLSLIRWPAVVVFLAVSVPWFVAVQQRHAGFLDYFFMEQHVRRFMGHSFNNVQPFWFYVPVLFLIALPSSVWWIKAGKRLVVSRPWSAPAARLNLDGAVRLLMWCWAITMLVFFSIPSSKLVGYILVVMAPLAWIAADGMPFRWGDRPARWVVAAGAVACVTILGVLVWKQPADSRQLVAALIAGRAPSEPVFAYEINVYDLRYQTKSTEEAMVVSDWSDPSIALKDNWRKELADAARFDPDQAARVLVSHAQMAQALCKVSSAWVFAVADAAPRTPLLQGLEPVAVSGGTALWHVETAEARRHGALVCH